MGHCEAWKIMPRKDSSHNIGNQIRYLPVCSAVPQPIPCTVFCRPSFRVVHKLWKATVSFTMSVCLSLNSAWKISAPTGRIFMKRDISILFENLSRKFEFNQNLTIMGTALLLNVPTQLLSSLHINFPISAPKMYDVLLLTHHTASTLFHLFFLHLLLEWYKALFWHSAC